jgi:predicted acyl esterase
MAHYLFRAHYTQQGYVHVVADSRGSAPSEGRWELSGREEQQDGYDLVEWMARQPWCTGKIAMAGGSYYAQIQFLVAATQPPHLVTIVPFNGWTDLYRDFVYHGGLLHGFIPPWIAGVMGRVQAPCDEPPPARWQPPIDLLGEILVKNRFDGPFYRERSVSTRYDLIKVPVYHLVSTASYNHYRGQLLSFTEIQSPQKLMLLAGNLRRAMYSPPISAEIVRWLDYWLKDADNGIMKEPPVTLLVQGSDRWRFEREYPLARTRWTEMYLHGGERGRAGEPPWGLLSEAEPEIEPPDEFDYPECAKRVEANEPVLAYLTRPFSEDTEIVGPVSLTLYAAATAADTALVAKIDDVEPDGSWRPVSKGWLKAAHRKVDRGRSRPGRPFHPHEVHEPLEPGKVYEFEIEIWPLCRCFKAGHRLRLRIANSDSRIHDAGNTHTIVEVPMRVTVHHSKEYPSRLLLPVIPPDPHPVAAEPLVDYLPH